MICEKEYIVSVVVLQVVKTEGAGGIVNFSMCID